MLESDNATEKYKRARDSGSAGETGRGREALSKR